MNYEEFYQNLQVLEKSLTDKLLNTQKSFKKITNNTESGDLRSLKKNISLLSGLLTEFQDLTAQLNELAESFDAKEYFTSGEFAKQLADYCDQYSVDLKGEFPAYEIFPFSLKIDADNQDLYVNRKKYHCVRPLRFVQDIEKRRGKYLKAAFNVSQFINELAAAYDLAIVIKGQKSNNILAEHELNLRDLYAYLAPTQRARSIYNLQNYAFDLARLYASEVRQAKDLRQFAFGPSKIASKFIRILDQHGKEQLLGTIRFYHSEY